jgi:hypothetical protein
MNVTQLKEAIMVDPDLVMELEMKLLELRRAMGRRADAIAVGGNPRLADEVHRVMDRLAEEFRHLADARSAH